MRVPVNSSGAVLVGQGQTLAGEGRWAGSILAAPADIVPGYPAGRDERFCSWEEKECVGFHTKDSPYCAGHQNALKRREVA